MQEAVKVIQNNKKTIITIIVIIVLFIIIRREWPKIKLWFQPRNIDLQPGESPVISETRKRYLENLAEQLYKDIYDTPIAFGGGGAILIPAAVHNSKLYTEAAAVTDNELLYLADFYKRFLSNGVSLWDDIDNEFYANTPDATKLQSRLSKIGER